MKLYLDNTTVTMENLISHEQDKSSDKDQLTPKWRCQQRSREILEHTYKKSPEAPAPSSKIWSWRARMGTWVNVGPAPPGPQTHSQHVNPP